MNVSMWVLYKHVQTDQQPSVCSHAGEQKHVKRLYDGIVGNESDVLLLRKAAPVVGSYQVDDDLISYCREPRAGEHGLQWSVGSRLIGFEKDKNSISETQPRTCIWDSVPVCVAIFSLLVRSSRLFWLSTARKPKVLYPLQQKPRHDKASSMNVLLLIVRRLLTHHELLMMNKTMKMSEPTQTTTAEKWKVDETAKELRASLPTTSPHHMRVHHDLMMKHKNSSHVL